MNAVENVNFFSNIQINLGDIAVSLLKQIAGIIREIHETRKMNKNGSFTPENAQKAAEHLEKLENDHKALDEQCTALWNFLAEVSVFLLRNKEPEDYFKYTLSSLIQYEETKCKVYDKWSQLYYEAKTLKQMYEGKIQKLVFDIFSQKREDLTYEALLNQLNKLEDLPHIGQQITAFTLLHKGPRAVYDPSNLPRINPEDTEKSVKEPVNSDGTLCYKPENVQSNDSIDIFKNSESVGQSGKQAMNAVNVNLNSAVKMNINILLLGETGVGKSTFINGLVNNISYKTLDEAIEGGPKILMDTRFAVTDETHHVKFVEYKASYDSRDKMSGEYYGEMGESYTRKATIYSLPWFDNGHKVINIIDTPGINDTRGQEQDQLNMDQILREVNRLGTLHAICILLKPNMARLSSSFRYCLDQLLTRLHRSATNNILFCFTNTRSTLYRPGDTLSVLLAYLNDLEKTHRILIKADKNNIFCFDNDCFRYVLAVRKGVYSRTKEMDDLFGEGWEHNVEETCGENKFLHRVQSLQIHDVQDTVSLNTTMKIILTMAQPLAEIVRYHLINIKNYEDEIAEMKKLKPGAIPSRVRREIKRPQFTRLTHPITICKSKKCTTIKPLDGHDTTEIYTTCHYNCHLNDMIEGNYNLQYCKIFYNVSYGNFTGYCCECGCNINYHQHTYFKKSMVSDKLAVTELENQKDRAAALKEAIEDMEDKVGALNLEHDIIRDFCVEAAVFLQKNSIKAAAADPYRQVIEELKREEEIRSKITGNPYMSYAVEALVISYNDRYALISEEIVNNRRASMNTKQLMSLLDNLTTQRICGCEVAKLREDCQAIVNESMEQLQE